MEEDPLWPICQSCARPLLRNEDFGTQADGSICREYCHHCVQDGHFTEPDLALEEMIRRVTEQIVASSGMPRSRAEEITRSVIPELARWNGQTR